MRSNKFLALLLTLTSILFLFPAAASATAGDNLLTNGDFAGGTTSWSWATGSELSTDIYYGEENTNAAKITKTETLGQISVIQTMSATKITPGAVYRASAKLRGELQDESGFRLVVKFYSQASGEFGSASSTRYTSTTQERWVDIAFDFVVPEECDRSLQMWLRLDGKGTVYVDDVVLVKTDDPDPFHVETSHVFHYTGDKTGTAQVTLHNFYDENSEEAQHTVTFSIRDGLTYLARETVGFTNRQASFTYNVDEVLPEKQKRYIFEIKVFAPGNVLAAAKSYSQGLYLYDRPTRLNENGEYLIDGEVFNPVIGYHVAVEDYAKVKEAGINVVQIGVGNSNYLGNPEGVEKVLEALETHDLYGLFCLYLDMTAAGTSKNLANTQKMAELLATEERVFAWAVQDEPLGGGVTTERLDALEKSYHEIRSRDSMHPVYICDFSKAYFDYDVKYCDVFAPDIYSSSQTAIQTAAEAACAAAKKAGNKPVYMIVSTYKSATGYLPTGDVLRSTVYQSVLGGADGVGFYSFSDAITEKISETGEAVPLYEIEQLWPTMLQLREELPILFATAVRKSYTEEKTDDYILRKYGFGGRMIVLPLCDESCTLPLEAGRTVTILCGDEALLSEGEDGTLQLSLGKYTPILWQYGPSPDGALHILQNGEDATRVSGTLEIVYTPGTADLYAVLYEKESRKIRDIWLAKNTAEALVVTVPEGEYTLSAFAFLPGTMQPMTKKKSL